MTYDFIGVTKAKNTALLEYKIPGMKPQQATKVFTARHVKLP
jgi:hypothetical protein